MLTINNVNKVYKRDVGEWRIGKVLPGERAYVFILFKPIGERLNVNLERDEINGIYELWYKNKVTNKKESIMITSDHLASPDKMVSIIKILITQ